GKVTANALRARTLAGAAETLSGERTDDVTAMRHVLDGKPVTTHQQKTFAEILGEEGTAKFFDRVQRLKGGSGAQKNAPEWDGKSRCPWCRRGRDVKVPEWLQVGWEELEAAWRRMKAAKQ